MSDLNISGELLRGAAGSLTDLVGSMPQHSIVDLSGCGSTAVAQAAADFDLWVVLTGRIASERVQGLSGDASLAADEADELDAALAAGTEG